MGQYWRIINTTKNEMLRPHPFGDGAKLLEFSSAGEGMMMALAYLMASPTSHGQGGGDGHHPMVGRWAGNRIVIVGDYEQDDRLRDLYEVADDITEEFLSHCKLNDDAVGFDRVVKVESYYRRR